jgi:phage gp36-like protein
MYASPTDMENRFGLNEMIRLTTPDGATMGTEVSVAGQAMIEEAITGAGELVDSYLRRRYQVPLDVAPHLIKRVTMVLARHDLAHGDQRAPSQQMVQEHDEALVWLEKVRQGDVLLDLAEVATGDESFAMTTDRMTAGYQTGVPFQPAQGSQPQPLPATDETFGTW